MFLLMGIIIMLALYTISTIHPVSAVISLISIFMLTSIYLAYLSINFLAITYIIIYVGAIAILFLFIVMMINVKYLEVSYKNSNLGLSAIIISMYGISYSPLIQLAPGVEGSYSGEFYTSGEIEWENMLVTLNQLEVVGNNLYIDYGLWLILISWILLLAMIGPIVLIKKC